MTNPLLDWNADDAANLRAFIAKCPKFLAVLKSRRTKCEGDTMEKRAVTGSTRQGEDNIIEEIENTLVSTRARGQASPFLTE